MGHEKKSSPLELVHSDVFGPTEVTSIGGANYFVTFFDDFTRKVWIYMLHKKSEVFSKLKFFKDMVENQIGKKIKCLLTDNGGEFCSLKFDNFCADNGIRRIKTVPFTPQKNGGAERLNQTILERARCMLSNAGLGKEFWAEACNTTVYLINRAPSSRLDFDIPEERWTSKRISFNHLRVFGCDAYVHIPEEQRTKLDFKSKRCVFLGYGEHQFDFRLWDPVTQKVICSKDVIFNEKSFSGLHNQNSTSADFIKFDLFDNGNHVQRVPWVTFHPSTAMQLPFTTVQTQSLDTTQPQIQISTPTSQSNS